MATYGTALIMRALESEILKSATEFPDVTLLYYAENFGKPVIDARMNAAGHTTPFESPAPSLIILLDSMLGVSALLQSTLVKYSSRNVERARTLLDDAHKMMDKIQAGSMDLGTVTQSDAGSAVYVDPDPEERPASSVFAGPPEQWQELTETRET